MEKYFRIEDSQFSVTEAADHLRICRSNLYSLIRQKKIKTVMLGGRRIIPGVELKRFMDELAAEAS